jgi:ribose-phosphate pyrophosphokinase
VEIKEFCRNREKVIYIKIRNDVLVFSGGSNQELSNEVCQRLGINLGKAKISRFVDGECNIQIYESIRGKEVYIIQSTCPPVNENIVELLLLISTMKRTSAKKITAIIPYYGYGRAVIIK